METTCHNWHPNRADQVSGGVFLIGLAILFLTGNWWPGILFVIGTAAIAKNLAQGNDWGGASGGLWLIIVALLFTFGFSLPSLLIFIGMSMLLKYIFQSYLPQWGEEKEKRKNEDKLKREEYI
jgi:hypothetical protein